MNILFYGNCQLYGVLKTLNLDNTYNIFDIPCWRENIDNKYFTDIINKCDIIITQPINDNYRDVDYLSTSYIIKHKKSNCKLIIFDSCVFNCTFSFIVSYSLALISLIPCSNNKFFEI